MLWRHCRPQIVWERFLPPKRGDQDSQPGVREGVPERVAKVVRAVARRFTHELAPCVTLEPDRGMHRGGEGTPADQRIEVAGPVDIGPSNDPFYERPIQPVVPTTILPEVDDQLWARSLVKCRQCRTELGV